MYFTLFPEACNAAQNSNVVVDSAVAGPLKENRILKKSSELEQQIENRRLQAEALKDPKSEQYRLGYKDGYNKAVIDLIKANLMPESPNSPLLASSSNDPHQVQQSTEKNIKNYL